ncbi:MAG: TIGR03564 family F420-dependent LLM class oxidoreductase [Dehalococcoidia bacterium]
MRIGLMVGEGSGSQPGLEGLIENVKNAESAGFHTAWMANIFGLDAISSLAIAGRETSTIELGTAVVPTYPRHPMAIAQQALTAQAAANGRFVLGIGLSHQVVIESMMGLSYAKPARHMREYLEVTTKLLRGEAVAYQGEEYRVNGQITVPVTQPPQVMVAALGPAMLKITGRLADGTITWMTGNKTLAAHIVPGISESAKEHGRPAPRIAAGFPIAVTDDTANARKVASQVFVVYGQLPSYRAMLDREGAANPEDIAMVGTKDDLRAMVDQSRQAGVTDFCAAPYPADATAIPRTMDFLASLI